MSENLKLSIYIYTKGSLFDYEFFKLVFTVQAIVAMKGSLFDRYFEKTICVYGWGYI